MRGEGWGVPHLVPDIWGYAHLDCAYLTLVNNSVYRKYVTYFSDCRGVDSLPVILVQECFYVRLMR